jgi:probable phosphoglycerate mutase
MTRVLRGRHGQSEWNADGRWQGQADPPLTDLGRRQARDAARALGTVDAVVTSDLQRAAETAGIISEVLGVGPIVVDPDLRERHAGEWQGLTRAEIERDWPGYLGAAPPVEGEVGSSSVPVETDGRQRRPPGWETDDDLVVRAVRALASIRKLITSGEVVAVTHGGLVYALETLLGAPFVRLPNLGARWIEVGPGGPEALGDRVLLVPPEELTIPAQI